MLGAEWINSRYILKQNEKELTQRKVGPGVVELASLLSASAAPWGCVLSAPIPQILSYLKPGPTLSPSPTAHHQSGFQ